MPCRIETRPWHDPTVRDTISVRPNEPRTHLSSMTTQAVLQQDSDGKWLNDRSLAWLPLAWLHDDVLREAAAHTGIVTDRKEGGG